MPRLTKRVVDAARPGDKDLFVWDDELRGFGLRVRPSGRKFYVAQRKRDGRTVRVMLGEHDRDLTCEQARHATPRTTELFYAHHGLALVASVMEAASGKIAAELLGLPPARPKKRPTKIAT